ncbi:MAG: para-nitrobenzyl esterase [Mycobacterium sp.]|jgi:para-nitrobenzyl esterase|nr:para-nitrobenzyl esterase [Mycobacterium sp.]
MAKRAATKPAHVRVEQGDLEGTQRGGLYRFMGVPYAKAPVGDLRWRAPAPATPWRGRRAATGFGAACPQPRGALGDLRVTEHSEDCLFLNVWTRTLERGADQPVMVWIHGGANLAGAGSEDLYDGARLAARGATVVTFNYRLGAFGFLAHPDFGANFAVQDHLAALKWVARNIAEFGGDPNNVTIFGQSAGALAVRTLLSSPPARGLFHRAIMQSGGSEPLGFAPSPNYERATGVSEHLFDLLGSHDPEVLRKAPTDDLARASLQLSGTTPAPGHIHTPADLTWRPVPDDVVVSATDFAGWPQDVPVLLGCVENEARHFITPAVIYTRAEFERMAKVLAGPRAARVVALLEHSGHNWYEALDQLVTSAIYLEPALATLDRFTGLDRRVYYYHFARVSPGGRRTEELAKHGAEVRYVFGNLAPADAYDDTDTEISTAMLNAWFEFARTGAPRNQDGSAWPKYEAENPRCTFIDTTLCSRPILVSPLLETLRSLRVTSGVAVGATQALAAAPGRVIRNPCQDVRDRSSDATAQK